MDNPNDKSYLLITFDNEGSAHFSIEANKVTPMQMLTIAGWLKFEGEFSLRVQKEAILEQLQTRQQMQQIVIPKQR